MNRRFLIFHQLAEKLGWSHLAFCFIRTGVEAREEKIPTPVSAATTKLAKLSVSIFITRKAFSKFYFTKLLKQ